MITIIVLLILAGVTLSLTLGDNGLLKRAQDATNIYKEGEYKEKNEIDKINDILNDKAPKFEDDGTCINVGTDTMEITAKATDEDDEKLKYTINYGETKQLGKEMSIEGKQGEEVLFRIEGLTRDTGYYWKVKVTDGKRTVEGEMHSQGTSANYAPEFENDGILTSTNGSTASITAKATDREGDKLTYTLYWNETVQESQTKDSGEEVTFNLSGLSEASYSYRIDVKDEYDTTPGTNKTATRCTGATSSTSKCNVCGRRRKS